MKLDLARRLRLTLALWFAALAVGPVLAPGAALADTPGLSVPEAAPTDVAPDARAITDAAEAKRILDDAVE